MRVKRNFYEKMIDELLTGPKTISYLKKTVGVSVAARIHELNKTHGNSMMIEVVNNTAALKRVGRVKVSHKEVYPDYYENGRYIYAQTHKK